MYILIVTQHAEDPAVRDIHLPVDRYLEYTDDDVVTQLRTLSHDAVAFLGSQPCLLMQEGRSDEVAGVVRIEGATYAQGSIRFRVEHIECVPKLNNAALWRLKDSLDIGQFEFNRNHLAIKGPNLVGVLEDNGFKLPGGSLAQFRYLPLPAPSRSELIAARSEIAGWSHSEIDDLVLLIGIADLRVSRDLGSRRDRADALLRYVLDNPGAKTVENRLLSAYIVERSGIQRAPRYQPEKVIADDAKVPASRPSGVSDRVFVVHGRNETVRESVVAFLRSIGLKGVVLHEQPNMGRHLLTKFIQEAELTTFAVILMTDDDVGGRSPDALLPRARQNVILELGYFISYLGQERVCALVTPGLETPSDFDGIVYIRMDAGGGWQHELLRELEAARLPVVAGPGAV